MGESKLEEILKGENPDGGKPSTGQANLKTALEQELEGEDSELAKELQRTRAEEIIARRRLVIERMRAGQAGQDTGGSKIQERGKEWLTDVAQGLLERGLDPSVVGRTIDYLLGIAHSPLVGLPGSPAPAQGITFADMKDIFKMGQEANRTDPAIASILEKLSAKIQALEERKPPLPESPPKTSVILVKADGSIQEFEGGKPILLEPKPTTGESLEVVRERNRHAEKMEEIGTERDYKTKLTTIAGDAFENIGRGLASQVMEEGTEDAGGEGSHLEYFTCPEEGCGTKIPVTPQTQQIICPKCKGIYQRTTA